MSEVVVPLPAHGDAFFDARGEGRAMRVSWHRDVGVVVLSVWQAERCTATVRLDVADVPELVRALVSGLVEA